MQEHPFIFSDELKYRLGRHFAFWAFWWLFFSILYSYSPRITLLPDFQRMPVAMVDSVFFMLLHIFLSYSLMYFVIPLFVVKGRYKIAAVLVLILFILTGIFSSFLAMNILPAIRHYIFGKIEFGYPNTNFLTSLLAGLRGGITIGGLAAAIKLMKYWYVKEQRNLQLQKENIESQLEILKAQVHPHFLFNTLNNIYSYAQNTSPDAAKMISGLSDILRFMLYESDQKMVALSKELKMLQDYINLEKVRYGNKLELHIDLPEKTDGLYIAPLLLLPFVENSFKHGASNVLEQPWINLKIDIRDNQLRMKLLNGKSEHKKQEADHSGIGIKNVKKRLELLYPGKYELNITEDEDVFIVNLKLELEYRSESTIKSKSKEPEYA